MHKRIRKFMLIVLATAFLTTIILFLTVKQNSYEPNSTNDLKKLNETIQLKLVNYPVKNWRNLSDNDVKKLSKLGQILYGLQPYPKMPKNTKQYQILVWKYGPVIENRHLKNFGFKEHDPFEFCSVQNCEITYESPDLASADLVLFHLQVLSRDEIPTARPSPSQIWTFLTDESPFHTFARSSQKLALYNGLFNWSMTYRSDSDIPVPYGRTVALDAPPADASPRFHKRDDVFVAIMGSNCGGRNNRWQYVNELKKHIGVDVYGGCGTLKRCPGHFRRDCPAIGEYRFYLAFENSNCDEYVTEKLWWNAFAKEAIPIVMGASERSYAKLLPPGSYINVEQFAHPKDLAEYLLYLVKSKEYRRYYRWKTQFQVLNEHGYFRSKSVHYCRICQALNYNDRTEKVYNDLGAWWSPKNDCYPAWDA